MVCTRYRIIDLTDDCIRAQGLTTLAQAVDTLALLNLDYPTHAFEIASYEQKEATTRTTTATAISRTLGTL